MKDLFEVARAVQGIVIRQDYLDWKLVYSELEPLCELKGAPDIVGRLKQLQRELKSK